MSIGLAVWDIGFSLVFESFVDNDRNSWYNRIRLRRLHSDLHRYVHWCKTIKALHSALWIRPSLINYCGAQFGSYANSN